MKRLNEHCRKKELKWAGTEETTGNYSSWEAIMCESTSMSAWCPPHRLERGLSHLQIRSAGQPAAVELDENVNRRVKTRFSLRLQMTLNPKWGGG